MNKKWKKDYAKIRYKSANAVYIEEKTKELIGVLESHAEYLTDSGIEDPRTLRNDLEQQASWYANNHDINLHSGILSQIVDYFLNPNLKTSWLK